MSSENQELINAQDAVKNSGLKTQNYEMFNAAWSFDGKDDLCQSIFDFYNEPFDDPIAAEIINLIGTKAEDESIDLSDELLIQLDD